MRVNIQYAVELNEIPNEVINILKEFDTHLTGTHPTRYRNIKAWIEEGTLPDALEEIDRLRIDLSIFDQRLEDATALLTGFLKEKSKPLVAEEEFALTEKKEEKQNVD